MMGASLEELRLLGADSVHAQGLQINGGQVVSLSRNLALLAVGQLSVREMIYENRILRLRESEAGQLHLFVPLDSTSSHAPAGCTGIRIAVLEYDVEKGIYADELRVQGLSLVMELSEQGFSLKGIEERKKQHETEERPVEEHSLALRIGLLFLDRYKSNKF